MASYSLRKNSTVPLDIIPLKRRDLEARGIYKRAFDPKQSTEFTYLRFFVPYLNNYKGWALFADDDFLWLGDVKELIDQADDKYAVMCVKHDYNPEVSHKLANLLQEPYPRKNWSSMMLLNCGHPANRALTLQSANDKPGSFLHRFSWIMDDSLIGAVHFEWNFLVKHHTPRDGALPKAIHYTEGGPWFPDYRDTDYAAEWLEMMREYESTLSEVRMLCPYERFSTRNLPVLDGYPNSHIAWNHIQDIS